MERKLLKNFETLKPIIHYYAKYCPLGNCTYDTLGGTCWNFFLLHVEGRERRMGRKESI